MLVYVLAVIAFLEIGGFLYLVRKSGGNYDRIRKIVAIILIAVFAVRFMSYEEIQIRDITGIDFSVAGAGPSHPILNITGNILIWFEIAAFLMIVLEPFFETKVSKFISLYIGTPMISLCFFGAPLMLLMMRGNLDFTITNLLLGVEVGGLMAFAAINWLASYKIKFYRPTIIKGVLAVAGFMICAMPTFIPRSIFGNAPGGWNVDSLEAAHRMVIYLVIMIPPFIIYFALRNQSASFIRYSLLFITTAVMINFTAFTKYVQLCEPWNWPIHLCNTVLYVLPICFIFKPKRLFYFTYFINVFGAMFAILMPNVVSNLNDPDMWRFWFNHGIAFWMPLLAVALKVFEKPKLKQYFYSTGWFAGYFIFVAALNLVFSTFSGVKYDFFGKTHTIHGTDFFFLNSTFLPNKLGVLGLNVYEVKIIIDCGAGRLMTIRPLFYAIYFIAYFLLGFGIWFVYVLFFNISDAHYELHLRLKAIKMDRLALESKLDGRSIEEPMDKNADISYKLINFSKKYAGRKVYAVEKANLEVHGGEIFGFLGPNGAGKSTIIKSTVGIQPISEGNIQICGYDCASQPIQAKSLIGFVPDHYALYEKLTGREYLNYIADIYKVSKEDREERLNKYIKLFELEQAIDNKIKTYSHGMKQKITIMAALVHEPKIWILDEPLTGLDPQSIYQVKQCMIEHAKKGNIVFFSSHIIDIVEKLCDRIAIIKKGHILCVRNTADVEKEEGSLEKYYLDMIGDTVTERE